MRGVTRIAVVVGAVAVVGGAAVAAARGVGGGSAGSPASTSGLPPATAPVTRATVTQTQQVGGTLGYGAQTPLAGSGHGRVTWLPALGATLRRGAAVYRNDNVAVPLFYGSLPLYRQLQPGDVGDDVREVEANLVDLGYLGITVDDHYTAATATAVRHWQKDLGLTPTGVLDPSDVVVTPAAVRVAAFTAHLGDPANGTVLAYTGTARTVTVPLDVSLQTLVRPGIDAKITLPTGAIVAGRVSTVGTVATPGGQNGPATIDVTVTVGNGAALGTLDEAPVTVTLVSASVPNVLTVPVAALCVLADGTYGVQVVTGSTTHYAPVTLGMFGNGRVQVSGAGVTEGTVVGVPS